MKFRVLLITYYLIIKILVEAVLDVHIKCVKIKIFFDPDVVKMHFLQEKKGLWRDTCVGLHTENYIFLIRSW